MPLEHYAPGTLCPQNTWPLEHYASEVKENDHPTGIPFLDKAMLAHDPQAHLESLGPGLFLAMGDFKDHPPRVLGNTRV